MSDNIQKFMLFESYTLKERLRLASIQIPEDDREKVLYQTLIVHGNIIDMFTEYESVDLRGLYQEVIVAHKFLQSNPFNISNEDEMRMARYCNEIDSTYNVIQSLFTKILNLKMKYKLSNNIQNVAINHEKIKNEYQVFQEQFSEIFDRFNLISISLDNEDIGNISVIYTKFLALITSELYDILRIHQIDMLSLNSSSLLDDIAYCTSFRDDIHSVKDNIIRINDNILIDFRDSKYKHPHFIRKFNEQIEKEWNDVDFNKFDDYDTPVLGDETIIEISSSKLKKSFTLMFNEKSTNAEFGYTENREGTGYLLNALSIKEAIEKDEMWTFS